MSNLPHYVIALSVVMCQRLIHTASSWMEDCKKKFAVRKNLEERASPELLTHLLFI